MKKKKWSEERVPVPLNLVEALSCTRLRRISEGTGITEDRLTSIVSQRTKTIRRYEIILIRDFLDNHISPFLWGCEEYR